jgi:hypothetical protein
LVSNKALGNTSSGAKNSRMGTLSGKISKKVFKNIGVVTTPLKCFQKVL